MAGALTERDFVAKLERAGFKRVEVLERRPMSVEDIEVYPLFTGEVLELMRTLLPRERQAEIAVAAVFTARLPHTGATR